MMFLHRSSSRKTEVLTKLENCSLSRISWGGGRGREGTDQEYQLALSLKGTLVETIEKEKGKEERRDERRRKKNIPGKVCSSISAASMADKTNWRSFSMFINTSMHVKSLQEAKSRNRES